MKIFIIAGEDSGDKLGAGIIDGLSSTLVSSPNFVGVGGAGMISRGLNSIFPMNELSVMGFIEIASSYTNLKSRLDQTVSTILNEKPDILLTIDAPEFCFRVAKKVKSKAKCGLFLISFRQHFLPFILTCLLHRF